MKKFNNDQEYIDFLEKLKLRSAIHQPITASAIQGTLDEMIKNIRSENKGAVAEKWKELVKASRMGDVDARAKVARIRMLKVNNYLMALSNWLMFFNKVNLAEDEVPYWENSVGREVAVAYTGPDGKARRAQVPKDQAFNQIGLKKLSTEIVEYFLFDPIKGRIADEQKALIDLARDLKAGIDRRAKPFVTAAAAAFTTTGANTGRTYVLGGDIASGNVPTTNAIDVSDAPESSTRFSKAAMDAIIGYAMSFGDLFGMQLRPKAILVPASDVSGILADVTFTSQPNSIVEQIFDGGRVKNYAGYNFDIIPDITLAPADGFAYVAFDHPIGECYEKNDPYGTRDVITPESEMNNKGQMYQSTYIGFVQPKPWSPFVLRVKYK